MTTHTTAKRERNMRKTAEERQRWRDVWLRALANMPGMTNGREGSPTALQLCLGYKTYTKCDRIDTQVILDSDGHAKRDKNGRVRYRTFRRKYNNGASMHTRMAIRRGAKPRDPKRAEALLKLAGPYGSILSRMKLKQIGELHRFKYWPK